MTLYLASRSPRRARLLEQLGVAFEPLELDVDESWDGIEPAGAHVPRLALEKARAGQGLLASRAPGAVLAADTAVVLEGRILGKAEDAQTARWMLGLLAGRRHQVFTAVALLAAPGAEARVRLSVSAVTFAALAAADIERYLATGEPLGKAGGYAIQGRAAAFVTRLEGSYSGVVGLPLHETASLLREAGLREGL